MKPRNKRERECTALSHALKPVSEVQKRYAFDHCFTKKGIVRSKKSNEYICLECGHKWKGNSTLEEGLSSVVCPNCHKKISLSVSRRKTTGERVWSSFQVITTTKGYQVIRTFHVSKTTFPNKPAVYWIGETAQIFIKPGEKEITLARSRVFSYYNDLFSWGSELSVKDVDSFSYVRYDYGWADVIYPRMILLPELKRNGYTKNIPEVKPHEAIEKLLTNPHYETLAKLGRFDLWKKLSTSFINCYWHQIKMLIKANYNPKDIGIWADTVEMVKDLGYDDHSPKYILPKNLSYMHDFMVKKKDQKQRKEKVEKMQKEMPKFLRQYGRLLDVDLVDGDMEIKPLQSYKDFYDEGKAMHHCVETYFGRWDSLILSARIKGKRAATIELRMKDMSIIQCRAACNKKPEQYDRICEFINDNKQVFLKAKRMRKAG